MNKIQKFLRQKHCSSSDYCFFWLWHTHTTSHRVNAHQPRIAFLSFPNIRSFTTRHLRIKQHQVIHNKRICPWSTERSFSSSNPS
ncbi:hypothetical protein Mapa_001357 [Marchantia paleacea]|nr:hypothetical protein Mapa_001357 [Marchantia paleacea]